MTALEFWRYGKWGKRLRYRKGSNAYSLRNFLKFAETYASHVTAAQQPNKELREMAFVVGGIVGGKGDVILGRTVVLLEDAEKVVASLTKERAEAVEEFYQGKETTLAIMQSHDEWVKRAEKAESRVQCLEKALSQAIGLVTEHHAIGFIERSAVRGTSDCELCKDSRLFKIGQVLENRDCSEGS
jgi:hypothetical protein